jgi:hypothetical protein
MELEAQQGISMVKEKRDFSGNKKGQGENNKEF